MCSLDSCKVTSYKSTVILIAVDFVFLVRQFTCAKIYPNRIIREEQVQAVILGCTAADVILADDELPRLKVGDAVMINNAGAYAAVLSPMQFASLTPPEELVVLADGSVK